MHGGMKIIYSIYEAIRMIRFGWLLLHLALIIVYTSVKNI